MTRLPTDARLALASLLLFVTTGCFRGPSVWVESRNTLELPLTSATRLQAKTHNGQITITSSAAQSDKIIVEVHTKAGGKNHNDAGDCMEAIDVQTPVEGDTQHIRWKWNQLRGRRWGARVSYHITIPAHLHANARSHNGAISIEGLTSGARVESHNGGIVVENLDGDVIIETHNGPIKIKQHTGSIKASTHNGAISVASTSSDVQVTTHNGGVRLQLDSEPGPFNGRVMSHNGAINVDLPDDVSAALTATTHRGQISCKHTLSDMSTTRKTLRGKLGDGAGKISITTHNGGISIQ